MSYSDEQKIAIADHFIEAIGLTIEAVHNLKNADEGTLDDIPNWNEEAEPEFPWLDDILSLEGLHEVDDNKELRNHLSVDPDGTAWCADLISEALRRAGKPALGLRARDYANYGEPGDGSIGDLAVWQGHIGVVVNEDEVIGGNVSNEVKRSPHPGNHPQKDWFRNFLGFRKVV